MNRKPQSLLELVTTLPTPTDYYRGLSRRAETPPNNLLLSSRKKREDIRTKKGQIDFHERWVLLVALTGSGGLLLDQAPLRLTSGSVALFPPLHLHDYDDLPEKLCWLYITFDWPDHTASSEDWSGIRKLDSRSRECLHELVESYRRPDRNGTIVAAQLLEILRRLYPPGHAAQPARESLLTAVQKAASLASTDECLPSLAKRMGISESHLRARFRTETGISLGRYLREARLRKAAMWLRHEKITVKAAAERAGYPDIFTFSRAFSKVLGSPPSAVRQADQA